jgi:hypothetical protein
MTHANYWPAAALKSTCTQRLIALAENMPIDILRVRDDDIPGWSWTAWSTWVLWAKTSWKKSC